MEDIYFKTKRDFLKYLSTAQKFPNSVQGKQGTVYRKDDMVIKYLWKKIEIELERILQFKDVEVRDFYFAKAAIYVQNKLKACISEYAEGTTLHDNSILQRKIELLLEALTRLMEDVDYLSEEKIRMKDPNPGNILFDQDHFNFIDTIDCYYSGETKEDIKYLNMSCIMRNIYARILPKGIYSYLFALGLLNHIGSQDPRERLLQFQRTLEHRLGEPISTFGEAEEIVRRKSIIL